MAARTRSTRDSADRAFLERIKRLHEETQAVTRQTRLLCSAGRAHAIDPDARSEWQRLARAQQQWLEELRRAQRRRRAKYPPPED